MVVGAVRPCSFVTCTVAFIWASLGTVQLGCQSTAESTAVIVVFDASAELQSQATGLSVTIRDGAGDMVGTTEFDLSDPENSLPLFGLRLIPREGDASRWFHVEATLRDADDVLGEQLIRGRYVSDEVREVWVVFDGDCTGVSCPAGYRCQQGRCVEECVDPTPADGVTRSRPFACDVPCDVSSCSGDLIATCEDGALVVERECVLGCADATACNEVLASNVDRIVGAPPAELGDLEVTGDVYAFFGSGGSINGNPSGTYREAGTLDAGIRWERITVGSETYDVIQLRNLTIGRGAVLALDGAYPHIFLVHGEAVIDGRLQASGRAGAGRANDNRGPGGGTDGTAGATTFGGGAGGSFGVMGGAGGDGDADAPGGMPGPTYGDVTLIPLLAGSAGGAGATGNPGGDGAGGVQVSARTRIVVGPTGEIDAQGRRGETSRGSGGGGGGSGGAVLLEAPIVLLEQGQNPRIMAGGGDGGLGRDNGQEVDRGRATPGDAPGGRGGDGEEASGAAGGGGRIRINNAFGDGQESYEPDVRPRGSAFTVGMVRRAQP